MRNSLYKGIFFGLDVRVRVQTKIKKSGSVLVSGLGSVEGDDAGTSLLSDDGVINPNPQSEV